MSYTKVSKPSLGTYTKVNAVGNELFDEPIGFDSSSNYFDGLNDAVYTKVSKPGTNSVNITVGMSLGLLIPLTYCRNISYVGSEWTKVTKPT